VSHLQRILGEKHPSTICAMHNLANILGDQGRLEEAASILVEVVSRMQRILGPKHPWTLVAQNNLTRILHSQGGFEQRVHQIEILYPLG
jgi:hypothetical protein